MALEISTGRLRWAEPSAFATFYEELEANLSPLRWRIKSIAPSSGALRAAGRSSPPSLHTMLRRSKAAGVRLVDILTSPVEAARSAGVLELERYGITAPARFKHSAEAVDMCRSRLKEELCSVRSRELPGLPFLAVELGVSVGFIRYNCPSEVRLYLKERSKRIVVRTSRLRGKVRKVLLEFLLKDYRLGKIPSQKRLVELAVEITGAKKYTVRNVLSRLARKQDFGPEFLDLRMDLGGAVVVGERSVIKNGKKAFRPDFIEKIVNIAIEGEFSPAEIAEANRIPIGTLGAWIAARRQSLPHD